MLYHAIAFHHFIQSIVFDIDTDLSSERGDLWDTRSACPSMDAEPFPSLIPYPRQRVGHSQLAGFVWNKLYLTIVV